MQTKRTKVDYLAIYKHGVAKSQVEKIESLASHADEVAYYFSDIDTWREALTVFPKRVSTVESKPCRGCIDKRAINNRDPRTGGCRGCRKKKSHPRPDIGGDLL